MKAPDFSELLFLLAKSKACKFEVCSLQNFHLMYKSFNKGSFTFQQKATENFLKMHDTKPHSVFETIGYYLLEQRFLHWLYLKNQSAVMNC